MEKTTFEMQVNDYICMTTAMGIAVEYMSKATGHSVQEITQALHVEAHQRMDSFPPEYADKAISQYHKDVQAGASFLIMDISL